MIRLWYRIFALIVLIWIAIILYADLNLTALQQTGEQDLTLKHISTDMKSVKKNVNFLRQIVKNFRSVITDIHHLRQRGDAFASEADGDAQQKLQRVSTHMVLMNRKMDAMQDMIQKLTYRDVNTFVPGAKVGDKQNTVTRILRSNDKENLHDKCNKSGPDEDHERLRRKINTGVKEFWFYLRAKLKHIKANAAHGRTILDTVDEVLEDGGEQERSIITDIHYLGQSDNAADWREQEAKDLSDLVQRRLHYLQNPKNCTAAKRISCDHNKVCGFGCQIHHIVYCLLMAYGTKRTLILKSSEWSWTKLYKPLSETCLYEDNLNETLWSASIDIKDIQVVSLPVIDNFFPRPDYLPLAIPEDLAPRLKRLHGDPFVWWIGQFLKFMLKHQPGLQSKIDEAAKRLGFQKPIVGVHVRRTDKLGSEAAFHDIDEYMIHVHEYYKLLERWTKVDKRRVFLASDDPSVLGDARRKYPGYTFVSDPETSLFARENTRSTDKGLRGIVQDIHFLSHSDFLVCTFSSQVCRLAYEIMQTFHPDASSYFRSLDDIYYFGGQNEHRRKSIYKHRPRRVQEMPLYPGDEVVIAGNHWDGYSKGIIRNRHGGLFPTYKTVDEIVVAKMPTYPEVDNQ